MLLLYPKDMMPIAFVRGYTGGRDLNIPGRELKGVHLALEMLSQQNRSWLVRILRKIN